MDDLLQQVWVLMKFLDPITGDALTGRGDINVFSIGSEPVFPVIGKVSHCAIFILALFQGFEGLLQLDRFLSHFPTEGMIPEQQDSAQNHEPPHQIKEVCQIRPRNRGTAPSFLDLLVFLTRNLCKPLLDGR